MVSETDRTTFRPVATKVDLDTLDPEGIVAGYLEFRRGDPEPGPNRGRAYWHGWRNRAHDAGEIPGDAAMAQLAHEVAPGDPTKRVRARYNDC